MASSASAITDQLITVLAGITNVGSGNAAKTYDVLETGSSQYVFVVRPESGKLVNDSFGDAAMNPTEDVTFLCEGFVKDLGNPVSFMDAQLTLINDFRTAIDDKRTLNSTVEVAIVDRWEVPDMELNISGQIWQPIRFWVRCMVIN